MERPCRNREFPFDNFIPGASPFFVAARCSRIEHESGVRVMRLYRIDKLAKRCGAVVKRKHILANSDVEAVSRAEASDDCPICDVLRDGKVVGEIV
jgi:hypothetical protein